MSRFLVIKWHVGCYQNQTSVKEIVSSELSQELDKDYWR